MKWAAIICALATGCATGQPRPPVTQVQSDRVANLYVFDGELGEASLASDTRAILRLRGRCLVLDYDGQLHTPIFIRAGEPPVVEADRIFIYSKSFPLDQVLSMPGLIPSEIRVSANDCPEQTIIIPSISD